MAKAPAFQFYASDWRSDGTVSLMSLEEEGAFIRLLAFAWLEGSIPADSATRAKVLRVTKRKADALWSSVLSGLFVPNEDGDGLVNPRQEEQRREYEVLRKQKSKAGKASALARATSVEQEANR